MVNTPVKNKKIISGLVNTNFTPTSTNNKLIMLINLLIEHPQEKKNEYSSIT